VKPLAPDRHLVQFTIGDADLERSAGEGLTTYRAWC